MSAARQSRVAVLSGSPSKLSKTARLADHVSELIGQTGSDTSHLQLREISPAALLSGDFADPAIESAMSLVSNADGIVLATPTYKAAYSGLLKAFLDLLPQFGLLNKVVLPIATGGSMAHFLALDYGLRPVVQSMRPRIVVSSVFVLESDIVVDDAKIDVGAKSKSFLCESVNEFVAALQAHSASTPEASVLSS